MIRPKVLFLCTGNSARSQMAEGFLRDIAGEHFEALSAGIEPKGLNPLAVEVMREIGIDISQQQSKHVGGFLGTPIPYVITVCDSAKEHCPIFPETYKYVHWSIEDPAAVQGTEDETRPRVSPSPFGALNGWIVPLLMGAKVGSQEFWPSQS